MADYGDYIFYSGGDKNYMLGYVGKEESIVLPESYEGKSYEIYRFIPTYSSPLSITVSSGVTHIADGAFEYRSLIEVINKSSLDIRIGSEEHGGIALYALEVHSGESRIVEYGDYLFYDAADNNYLLGYMGKEENIVLPDGFNGERYEVYSASGVNVVSVTIPACVTKLREYALSSLTLRTVIIEKGVTYIDSNAFWWYNNVADIYYTGTEDEWKEIVENGNLIISTSCQLHFNYVP